MIQIREATAEDWPQIYPFWSEIVEAGETYAYPGDLTSEESSEMWMYDHVVVAVEGEAENERILGSAKMGPNRPGRGRHIGTASFMVSSAARGKGIGRALGDYCVSWHREQGFHGIQFNAVVETNTTAVRLWQSLGFQIIGTVPDAFDSKSHGRVGLHVMYLPLT
ncbi:GNAT family N-acetyltransferase [Nocardioides panzhihuensis]|uniref:GNAT superfamily N-acetyltransferase n=1 Tax=Nocardioides panzhihuensis TaxID=860243 RepID=A0A7Z0DI55_9ACTN|nr:GNAT superfamily N-acetyltransferase [Nocardioides panzhihuensis]